MSSEFLEHDEMKRNPKKRLSAVEQISDFVTLHWKALLVFYLIVNSYSKLENTQTAQANRLDKLEIMQSDINNMKETLSRVDERTKILVEKKK